MKIKTALLLPALVLSPLSFADCGFEGSATNQSGSDRDGSGRITTSWNKKDAYPRNGSYQLELGSSACGEKVTVYADGKKIGRYRLDNKGMTRLNLSY